MTDFTHLHLHTQYSLLDGANNIPKLVRHLKQHGMSACAITDHGWMAGVVPFWEECTKHGIKPLIGTEAYATLDPLGMEKTSRTRDNMHLVILCKDNHGYSLLSELLSEAAIHNFYYKPRIYLGELERLAGHVVVTSACLGGVLAKQVEFVEDSYGRAREIDQDSAAIATIENLASIFGEDFYLEIQDWDSGDRYQPTWNRWILQKATEMKIKTVITADAHYLTREDHKVHELLMAIQMKKTVEEYRESGDMQYGPYFYVKSPEEMLEGAKRWKAEEAYWNTLDVAKKCTVDFALGTYRPPIFKVEESPDYQEFLEWQKTGAADLSCLVRTS